MKAHFMVVLGVALLAARPAVAQVWGIGAHSIPAGVMGQSILRNDHFDSEFGDYHEYRRHPTSINIRTTTGRYVKTVRTDAQGRFLVQLRPGKYILRQRATSIAQTAHPLGVSVRPGRFVSVAVISSTYSHSGGSSGGVIIIRPAVPPVVPPVANLRLR